MFVRKNAGFDEKLKRANRLVQRVLAKHAQPVVACSFGKDSIVVLHLVRSYRPDVTVIWNNTGVEYPDTYAFAREMRDRWKLNLVEARPETTFWQIVDKTGFPIHPRNAEWVNQKASSECCSQLKKKPTMQALRRIKCDLYFTGLTAFESRLRMFSAKKYGKYFYSVKWRHWKCHPILDWTSEDVWEYHRKFGLPHNAIYDKDEIAMAGGIRTGCWCCPMGIKYGKLRHLRFYYPKMFDFLVVQKGLGEAMVDLRLKSFNRVKTRAQDFLANLNVKKTGKFREILKYRPCFFDKL